MIRGNNGLKPGTRVMVSYPLEERQQINNPARKLDGEIFVIRSRKDYPGYKQMFTLWGADSDAGMPYWFLPEELIPY